MKFPINHLDMVSGIDRSLPAHLIPRKKWWDALGMRFSGGEVRQIARKVWLTYVPGMCTDYITNIVAIPYGNRGQTRLMVMSPSGIFQIYPGGSNPRKRNLQDRPVGYAETNLQYDRGDGVDRWATVLHGDRLFFTNPHNRVRYTDGEYVNDFSEDSPCATFMEMFYDHLVTGNVLDDGILSPSRLQWSDVRNVGRWHPRRTNEADYYDCDERASQGNNVRGICGMGKIANLLFTYTPTYIYRTQYVGLPRVFLTEPWIPNIGCDIRYGLAAHGNTHYFLSFHNRNFFAFDGQEVRVIGDEIANYFFADVDTSIEKLGRLWCYVDEKYNEVAWVYQSNGSSTFDKSVIYNFKDKCWYPAAVEDISCFCKGGRLGSSIIQLAGTCDAQTGTCDELLLSSDIYLNRLWGSSNSWVLQDYGEYNGPYVAQGTAMLVRISKPFLETWDETYGDAGTMKESDAMVIHSGLPGGSSSQVELSVATRDNVDDAVTFVAVAQKWTPVLTEKRLSFPRQPARRIIRYRFGPVDLDLPGLTRPSAMVAIGTSEGGRAEWVVEEPSPLDPTLPDPPPWDWKPPYLGTYRLTLIGGGGGGGAKGLVQFFHPDHMFASWLAPSGSIYPSQDVEDTYWAPYRMGKGFRAQISGAGLSDGSSPPDSGSIEFLECSAKAITTGNSVWALLEGASVGAQYGYYDPYAPFPPPFVACTQANFDTIIRACIEHMQKCATKWDYIVKGLSSVFFHSLDAGVDWKLNLGLWLAKTLTPAQLYGGVMWLIGYRTFIQKGRLLWRCGGGAGGILTGRYTVTNLVNQTLSCWFRGTGSVSVLSTFVNNPWYACSFGGNGYDTSIASHDNNLLLYAYGGTGGGLATEPPGTPANGVGGATAVVTNVGAKFVSEFAASGESALAELPTPTGVAAGWGPAEGTPGYGEYTPVTQTPYGGAGWIPAGKDGGLWQLGLRSYPDHQGNLWGGGGCGQRQEDLLTLGPSTEGAPGKVVISYWKVGSTGTGFTAHVDMVRPALAQTSTTSLVITGPKDGVYTVSLHARGVVELKSYTGGTFTDDHLIQGTSVTPVAWSEAIRTKVRVYWTDPFNSVVYSSYLNRLPVVPGTYPVDPDYCHELDYVFTMNIKLNTPTADPARGTATLYFEMDDMDSQQIAPVDVNGDELNVSGTPNIPNPQWVSLSVVGFNQEAVADSYYNWKFSGFVENILGIRQMPGEPVPER